MIALPDQQGFPSDVALGRSNLSPYYAANLLRWFRGSSFDSYNQGDVVYSWPDSSPDKNCAQNISTTSGSRPTVDLRSTPNGRTSVAIALAKRGMTCPCVLPSAGNWTIFIVFKINTYPGSRAGIFSYSAVLTDGMALEVDLTGHISFYIPNQGQWASTDVGVVLGKWVTVLLRSTAGTVQIYVNGRFYAWASGPGSHLGGSSTIQLFEGYPADPANYQPAMNIADVAFYSAGVSNVERDMLFAYANDAYGIF